MKQKDQEPESGPEVSRREFFKRGAVGGVGAVAASSGIATAAQGAENIVWDYEADIVILGAGSVGLTAAIRARDLGAESVIVLEQNYDVGGKLAHSGGVTSLGGGDAIQERDRLGLDPEGLGLAPPLVPPEDVTDNPDLLFADMTDWSVVDNAALAAYRYNDRELTRAWADNAPAVRQFFMDNYVRFTRTSRTHSGGGMSKARAPTAMLKLGDVTDIKAGTISRQDAGSADEERSSPFNPQGSNPAPSGAASGAPGWIMGGFVIARALEISAKEKGVRFLVNQHMDEIIREAPNAGRVLGVRSSYSPRMHPETGERLEPFWPEGITDDRRETIHIRARKAIIIGTGGMQGNVQMRTMFDPRLSEESIALSGNAWLGPRHMDGSGIMAAMNIGGSLAGMFLNYQHYSASPRFGVGLATWGSAPPYPGHPTFGEVGAYGINIGNAGWEHIVAVNQVGKRFYNESDFPAAIGGDAHYPPGSSGTNNPFVVGDWRNSSVEHIRGSYSRTSAVDAALAINEGSEAPDFKPGPRWAIFDSTAVEENDWPLRYPFISEKDDGFLVQADTLEELAQKVMTLPFQKMPLKYLKETIERYNTFAETGVDEDFAKPVMHKLEKAPFYAAFIRLEFNDSYGGLRINGKAQVVDWNGNVIPGLYAGGEATGGGSQHGIGRAAVHGYIAATHAVNEPS